MSHEIENKNGVYSFVYAPSEGPGWHHLGKAVADTESQEAWRAQAGHGFTVSKHPLFVSVNGQRLDSPKYGLVRDDNSHVFDAAVSKSYKIVQPSEIDDFCDNFASLDERLVRSAAGTLFSGERMFSTYAYQADFTVAGEAHKAHLMGTTTFDGSGATVFWLSMTRAVCLNTIIAGLMDSKAMFKTRHNATFDKDVAAEKLADLALAARAYKRLGDSLARAVVSKDQVKAFIRNILDIPLDAKKEDISTRKINQGKELVELYSKVQGERNSTEDTAWNLLQMVTDYADHTKSVRASAHGDNEDVARWDAANFGSGNVLKGKAVNLLMPLIRDKVGA